MKLEDLCQSRQAGSLELAVDLSNVCRNSQLDTTGDTARWDRLLRVLHAWNNSFNSFERPVVLLVADENLRHLLSPSDRRLLKQAVQEGFALESPKADPLLLDLAEECDCLVLSNDNFVSYRRGRPWIEEESEPRFVQVKATPDSLDLEVISLRSRTSFSKSRAEEQDEMKERRIDIRRDLGSDLLKSFFRCDNPGCLRRTFLPDGALSPPERGPRGEAVCPGCKRPLTRVGEGGEVAVIKLAGADGSHPHRVPLVRGSSVTIGRASGDLSLEDILPEQDLRRVSREHMRVEFANGRVTVVDLSSSNGSSISRWDSGRRERGAQVALDANRPAELRARDMVTIAGVLSVERSGRRFPFDMEPLEPSSGVRRDAPRTVIHTGEEY